MLKLLGRDFYGVELRRKEWPDRVYQPSHARFEPMAAGPEKDFLGAFIAMCGEIEELRAYRDNDLHQTSPRIAEALGREDREINPGSLDTLDEHALRVLKGLRRGEQPSAPS